MLALGRAALQSNKLLHTRPGSGRSLKESDLRFRIMSLSSLQAGLLSLISPQKDRLSVSGLSRVCRLLLHVHCGWCLYCSMHLALMFCKPAHAHSIHLSEEYPRVLKGKRGMHVTVKDAEALQCSSNARVTCMLGTSTTCNNCTTLPFCCCR